jgi:REP element-mobilizing transposase RayT
VFRVERDRRRFLGLVAELPERFGTEVHAFVQMDNHYHLLVRCRRTDLSQTLRWLQTAYAIGFNWTYRRRGHVGQVPGAIQVGAVRRRILVGESRQCAR